MKLKFWNRSSLSRLGKDEQKSGPRLLARLLRDEDGSYLVYMTLLIPVVMGVCGLGTEAGRWLYVHQTLQNAADSAALSAAAAISKGLDAGIDPTTISITQAKAIATTYCTISGSSSTCFVDGQNNVTVTVTPSPAANPPQVAVTVAQSQSRFFSSAWLSGLQGISASAVAIVNTSNTTNCMLALGRTATGTNESKAIQLGPGNGSIDFSNCSLFSNSSASDSISLQGNGNITAGAIGTVGGTSISGSGSVSVPPSTGDPTVLDPFRNVSVPSSPAPPCVTQPAGKSITLSPGRYCGLNADKVDITLQAGTYILDTTPGNTALVVKNATVTDNGAGVTLVFTCSTCSTPSKYPSTMLDDNANGNIVLTAPTTGATAGIVLFGDRTMPLNTNFIIRDNANATFNGAIYLPNGELQTHGGGSGTVPCSQIIANTIFIKTSTFDSKYCSGGGAPVFGRSVALVE